tara:strand:- start:384 stop:926 length:543 start_codon:yes stop_codon:yes gene_type:complete
MKFLKFFVPFFLVFQLIFAYNSDEFNSRVSILNFGLDYTRYSSFDELHRSISIIPIMVEKENFEVGLYVTPFIKEEYDNYGNYIYDAVIDSYLVNLRFRFIGDTAYEGIKAFYDLAYSDGNAFNWKDIRVSWLEMGVFTRINHTSKLFVGYKKTLITNEDIDMDGFFVNLVFGHSFLRRK